MLDGTVPDRRGAPEWPRSQAQGVLEPAAVAVVIRRSAAIANPLGLHLRTADQFVRLARAYEAPIRVRYGDKAVDGKSILDLVTLAAACGATLEIEASGPDAAAALEALATLLAETEG
jgi:phosphotransferase system HPr (HPr) family protein